MSNKLKGKEAEEFKKILLPRLDEHIYEILSGNIEDPPAHLLIFFENIESSRTHYRHNVNPLYMPQVVKTLRTIADDFEKQWNQAFPNQN